MFPGAETRKPKPTRRKGRWTNRLVSNVVELRARGWKYRAIAGACRTSVGNVASILQRYGKTAPKRSQTETLELLETHLNAGLQIHEAAAQLGITEGYAIDLLRRGPTHPARLGPFPA